MQYCRKIATFFVIRVDAGTVRYMSIMKKIGILIVIVALVGGAWFVFKGKGGGEKAPKDSTKQSVTPFDKSAQSINDPASTWVIVNKRRPLEPKTYAPTDLVAPNVKLRLTPRDQEMQMRQETAKAVEELFAGAKQEGMELMVASAYRGYIFQENLYKRYVAQQGQAGADTQSARPGHSEHQTGLAVDLEPASGECEIEQCFADTAEGKWVAANAYKYGFVLRYHEDKDSITGYMYEPWHLRYVGKPLAEEVHKQGDPTLEEFFGLDPAPNYAQ